MADSEESGRGVLTWRRSTILRVIGDYAAVNRCSPTNREIAELAGLKSASAVLHHLRGLKAEGFLTYEDGSPRTVRLLRPGEAAAEEVRRADTAAGEDGSPRVSWVPFAGQVAAGEPIRQLDESERDRFPLPREVVGPEEGLFLLQVVGDSMIGVGIFPGDWVVVRDLYGDKPRDGDIVAALIDGIEVEGTVKTYRKVERRVWLMPQNPAYTPIPGDKAIIRGKVVAVLRSVGQRNTSVLPLA
jgi:repressor LexA